MRAHRWRWGLWRAFGMADAARFCSGPLRPPNQCLPLAKASCFNRPPWLLVGVKVPNGSGSADLVATRCVNLAGDSCSRVTGAVTCLWNGWCRTVLPAACQSSLLHPSRWHLLGFPCFGCVLTGDAGGCDVPLDVRPTFAFNQCLLLEGAKRQRLCRPSGNPVGVNLAGVSLFRMRAFRAFGMAFAFSGLEGAKQQRLCRPSGNPVGVNLAGVSLFRMRAHGWRWGLWRAFGMADAARFCSGPLRPPNQCLPLAKASCFNRPPWLLVGVKVPNGSGSADLVATRWAWILLGFPCFGCVLTGDAGGCDVPLERLMPHGAAQGRYVRPTNACCLPKLPASPVHLCF